MTFRSTRQEGVVFSWRVCGVKNPRPKDMVSQVEMKGENVGGAELYLWRVSR
jgi:hypothetical protein